ncbi:MAG: hypothetical protein ABW224_09150 [Kibdelosporangium sp.]
MKVLADTASKNFVNWGLWPDRAAWPLRRNVDLSLPGLQWSMDTLSMRWRRTGSAYGPPIDDHRPGGALKK